MYRLVYCVGLLGGLRDGLEHLLSGDPSDGLLPGCEDVRDHYEVGGGQGDSRGLTLTLRPGIEMGLKHYRQFFPVAFTKHFQAGPNFGGMVGIIVEYAATMGGSQILLSARHPLK